MSQSNNANENLTAAVLDLHAELENVLAAYEDLRIKTFIEKDVSVADTRIINAKINAQIAMAKARGLAHPATSPGRAVPARRTKGAAAPSSSTLAAMASHSGLIRVQA